MTQTNETSKIRWLTVTAMMGAMSTVLMMLEFPVPALIPPFIKFDFSDLPALISAFAMGPLSGVCVCLIKNLINLMHTSSGGVGEISNFILSCFFVLPAGIIYKIKKTKTRAIVGAAVGAVSMAVLSVFSNYYVVYPIYTNFMPMEAIIEAYKAINPKVENLWDCLIWFNLPFTFIKGAASTVITVLIYKYISPVLKGRNAPRTGLTEAQ
ncbi:MAG: ECF transporter S component [Huintestinicola sp.]